jgi:hypothetical protein
VGPVVVCLLLSENKHKSWNKNATTFAIAKKVLNPFFLFWQAKITLMYASKKNKKKK